MIVSRIIAADSIAAAGEGGRAVFRWMAPIAGWALFFLVVGIIIASFAIYRREAATGNRFWRYLGAALRVFAILVLLLMLMQPVLVSTRPRYGKATVLVLVDTSLSMGLTDEYEDEEERAQVAALLGLIPPEKDYYTLGVAERDVLAEAVSQAERISVVNGMFDRHLDGALDALDKQHEVILYGFSQSAREIARRRPEPEDTAAGPEAGANIKKTPPLSVDEENGVYTRIGSVLKEVLAGRLPSRIAAIILVTDGRNNAAPAPEEVIGLAQYASIPVFTVGVGDYHYPLDIELLNVDAPLKVAINDRVLFSVGLRNQGYEGEATDLRLTSQYTEDETGEKIDLDSPVTSEPVRLGKNGALQTFEFTHLFTEEDIGFHYMKLEINPADAPGALEGETTYANNVIYFPLTVVTDKLRVLYVEGYPRWEYLHLRNALIRDKSLIVNCFLVSSDDRFPQHKSESAPPLTSPRRDLNTLKKLAEFDVVIVGDVRIDGEDFGRNFAKNLVSFVKNYGGGAVFISGESYNPGTYRHSPVYKLLPIVLDDDAEGPAWHRDAATPFYPSLTVDGRTHYITRLDDNPETNERYWRGDGGDSTGLPGLFKYYAGIKKITDGATALAVNENVVLESKEKLPIFAVQNYGMGRVFYGGVDSLWRWRFLTQDKFFYRFYSQAIHWAAGGRLGMSRRFTIETSKPEYDEGEEVEVIATAVNPDYQPFYQDAAGTVLGEYIAHAQPPDGGEPIEVPLFLSGRFKAAAGGADTEGAPEYRGKFTPEVEGTWRLTVRDYISNDERDRAAYAACTFDISPRSLEAREPKMNKKGLRKLSELTKGEFYFPWEVGKLPDKIKKDRIKIDDIPKKEPLWDDWWIFVLFVSILTVEWFIRRWRRMM